MIWFLMVVLMLLVALLIVVFHRLEAYRESRWRWMDLAKKHTGIEDWRQLVMLDAEKGVTW